MRWERFWNNVNGDSGMVNTHSGKSVKVFTLKTEWVFMFDQNRCSR